MTSHQTTSWIFLATALATQVSPGDLKSISTIADGINHAVPTAKELETSLTWLKSNELVIEVHRKYSLTAKGKSVYGAASRHTSTLLKIWENLEIILNRTGN